MYIAILICVCSLLIMDELNHVAAVDCSISRQPANMGLPLQDNWRPPVHSLSWSADTLESQSGLKTLSLLWSRAAKTPLTCDLKVEVASAEFDDVIRSYVMVKLQPQALHGPFLRPHLLHVTLAMVNAKLTTEQARDLQHNVSMVMAVMARGNFWRVQLGKIVEHRSWNFAVDEMTHHLMMTLRHLTLHMLLQWKYRPCQCRVLHVSWL